MKLTTTFDLLQTDAQLIQDYLGWTYDARDMLESLVCEYRLWQEQEGFSESFENLMDQAENLLKKWEADVDKSPVAV
jgi:hypothetical protein